MKPIHVLAAALLALARPAIALAPAQVTAAQDAKAAIVGTWRLVSPRQILADGTARSDPDLGARPGGYMIYGATGRMCTLFTDTERPMWANSGSPTEVELQAMFHNVLAYCAAYQVDEPRGVIVYHLEIDQIPNHAGTSRERRFTLVGDRLTLYPRPMPAGVSDWQINLERVR